MSAGSDAVASMRSVDRARRQTKDLHNLRNDEAFQKELRHLITTRDFEVFGCMVKQHGKAPQGRRHCRAYNRRHQDQNGKAV